MIYKFNPPALLIVSSFFFVSSCVNVKKENPAGQQNEKLIPKIKAAKNTKAETDLKDLKTVTEIYSLPAALLLNKNECKEDELKTFFSSKGIKFTTDSRLHYDNSKNLLFVVDTIENQSQLKTVIDDFQKYHRQVMIAVNLIEDGKKESNTRQLLTQLDQTSTFSGLKWSSANEADIFEPALSRDNDSTGTGLSIELTPKYLSHSKKGKILSLRGKVNISEMEDLRVEFNNKKPNGPSDKIISYKNKILLFMVYLEKDKATILPFEHNGKLLKIELDVKTFNMKGEVVSLDY